MIIDAYSDPYAGSDLKIFDKTFGLPDPVFNQVAPQGVPAFDINNADQVGWTVESDLDTQWATPLPPRPASS